MSMLHHDTTFSSLMVYAQSIEESKHKRITRNLKRGKLEEQNQPGFKNNIQCKMDLVLLTYNLRRLVVPKMVIGTMGNI